MALNKSAGFEFLAVVLLSIFAFSQALAIEIPPTPTAHYYGDADGNVSVNLSDIAQHSAYSSFKPCTYDTLQPQTSGQYWNTCDIDGNRSCNLSDIAILNSYLAFGPVSIGGDPWVLENINLPQSGNAPNTWIPFNINLYMTYGGAPSGRPGISVVAEIDPTSPGHGQLSGRTCAPVAGTRDQLSEPGAQCALAVTITDWQAGQEGLGLTESGAYGFQVWGDGDGDIKIDFHIEEWAAMDIPSVTLSQTVSFTPGITIWHVDDTATGANNGTSWADAFSTVQAGVDASSAGEQVWVAEGTYSTGTTTPVMTMKSGVNVFGGFVGTESTFSQRGYPPDHPTVLDGQNISSPVVLSASDTVLDGFIVNSGVTGINSASEDNVQILTCTITNCNRAVYQTSSNVSFSKCFFIDNSTTSNGGAVYSISSSSSFTNCVFTGNSASNKGGAIYNESGPLAITNSSFSGNSAQMGGAINTYYSSTTITNCILWGDSAYTSGMEIFNSGTPGPSVTYSDVMWGYAGTGNIDADPLFAGYPDLHLQSGSPCIDQGTSAAAPGEDIKGNYRPVLSGYDMGAYEFGSYSVCEDGIDNDGDTLTDWPADPGCTDSKDQSEYLGTVCDDGVDNDGDTFTDWAEDPGCLNDYLGSTEIGECQDGIDNDGDTVADYPADPGCWGLADNNEYGAACDDGYDNDGDTFVDWPDDLGCYDLSDSSEYGSNECDDGLDNDGDTFPDWSLDPGCTDMFDDSELGTNECDDGIDNDGDTLTDHEDPPCAGNPTGNSEVGQCQDGIDNDGDTFTDWPDDISCTDVTADRELGGWFEIGDHSASQTVNGISRNLGSSTRPSMALDPSGYPVVAWQDYTTGNNEIYVKRWDGSEWVELGLGSASGGGISNNGGDSREPSLAVDPYGNPIVAWHDNSSGNSEIYVKRWDGSSWVDVGAGSASGGGISDNSGNSTSSSLAIDSSGNPVVAWGDNTSGNYEIYVKRWNGSTWVEIGTGSASGGGISNNPGNSSDPSLALDSSGYPVVVWDDASSGNGEIYIRRWDGSSWLEIGASSATGGGISNDNYSSSYPSIALDSAGNPVVVWYARYWDKYNWYYKAFFSRWNGSEWITSFGYGWPNSLVLDRDGNRVFAYVSDTNSVDIYVGSTSPLLGLGYTQVNHGSCGNSFPSIATDGGSNWYVAWTASTGLSNEIFVSRWSGSDWVEVGPGSASGGRGGISNNCGVSSNPSLELDSSGNPVVTWQDNSHFFISSKQEVFVKRWDGSAWVEVGLGSASIGGIADPSYDSRNPSIAIDLSGDPVVAWDDLIYDFGPTEIFIKRWDGSAWVEIGAGSASGGGISRTAGDSVNPSLAIDSTGNQVVAWACTTLPYNQIYIKRWDGSAWVEMGAGSASGGGISNTSGTSSYPSLAIDLSGNPVVAWQDVSSGNDEVYVKRWDGSAWVEVGAGSASGGGISNSPYSSRYPSIAIDWSGNPVVAWEDNSSGYNQIYVRRWDGSAWVEIGAGSASGGGISNNTGYSNYPSIAIDSSGNPVVAWGGGDGTSAISQIYIKRWDGSEWVEVGAGSASGGGVSGTPAGSSYPSLACYEQGKMFLAWHEGSPSEIYIKRYLP